MSYYEYAQPFYDEWGNLVVAYCEGCEMEIYDKIVHECTYQLLSEVDDD